MSHKNLNTTLRLFQFLIPPSEVGFETLVYAREFSPNLSFTKQKPIENGIGSKKFKIQFLKHKIYKKYHIHFMI